ncbi:MAG: sensor histidine kinase [Rhodospirillaceae bacterium]
MMSSLFGLMPDSAFLPHGICLSWEPALIWLHVGSDSLIALAYFSIPAALFYFASRRPDLANRRIIMLFVAFIAACGTTHLVGVWTLWYPDYVADGLIKAATAAVSITTAVILWLGMPQALTLPSGRMLEEANRALNAQIGERERSERAVRELNAELERRVAERTAELTAALQEKELLFREIHHRVKNNLQVVSSLLQLEARNAPADFVFRLTDIQQRIKAMSLVHRQLYQVDQHVQVDLRSYLGELVEAIAESYIVDPERVRWTVDAAPINADIDIATPLALIVNEVLSNAVKHAFPGNRTGRIAISLTAAPEGARLSVRDDGVGMPAADQPRNASSMGLKLVALLSQQLHGKTEAVRHSDGTEFRIVFPLKLPG